MKVVVTANGTDLQAAVDPRFGRAAGFVLVDTESGEVSAHGNEQNYNAPQGAGIQAAQLVAELDADAVVSGNMGPKAFRTLGAAGIKVYLAKGGTVAEAVKQLQDGQLQEVDQANVEGHWI